MFYVYHTKVGPFTIVRRGDEWQAVFRGESLGTYASPRQAAGDLASGRTSSPAGWLDTTKLGISEDISDWTRFG